MREEARSLVAVIRDELMTVAYMSNEELNEKFSLGVEGQEFRDWAEELGDKAHSLFHYVNAIPVPDSGLTTGGE